MTDLVVLLENLKQFGDQFNVEEITIAVIENAKELAIKFAKDTMYVSTFEALENTEEFQYVPLKQQLLSNILIDEHYKVDDSLGSMTIFDESIAGTEADLIQGQEAAWRSAGGTPEQRLYCWTYGIYKPAREGLTWTDKQERSFAGYPTYETIINMRLQTWGDKAPYWRFLEWGNEGGGAYPTFPGTGFLSKAEARIPKILSYAKEIAINDMLGGLDAAVEEQLTYPDRKTGVYIGRVTLGRMEGRLVQVQIKRARAGIWYQLVVGGKFRGKMLPGEIQNLSI